MAFTNGDLCTPAALFPYATGDLGPVNLNNGMILDGPPLLGVVSDQAAADIEWNNGTVLTGVPAASYRYVTKAASGTVAGLLGKMVRLTSASQEFTGLVVSVFALEGGTTGRTGDAGVVTSEVVLFRTRTGQYVLALATSVQVAVGQ